MEIIVKNDLGYSKLGIDLFRAGNWLIIIVWEQNITEIVMYVFEQLIGFFIGLFWWFCYLNLRNNDSFCFGYVTKVSALNEAVPGSVKAVFKAWEQRLSSSEVIVI